MTLYNKMSGPHAYCHYNLIYNNICKCSGSNQTNINSFHPLEVQRRGSETQLLRGWKLNYLSVLKVNPNCSIEIFTHLKLCLADAIHNFQ